MNINRRTALAAFPLLPLAVTGASTAGEITPIHARFREWQAKHMLAEAARCDDDAIAAMEAMSDIEAEIVDLTPVTPSDVARQITAVTVDFDYALDGPYSDHLKASIRRLVSQGNGAADGSTGNSAAAVQSPPILQLFHRHQELVEAAGRYIEQTECSDAEIDRLFYDEIDALEEQVTNMPCTSVGDFAAKIIINSCRGEVFSDWETSAIWQEARELTGQPLQQGEAKT